MIKIPATLLAEVVADAHREAPREACGWLAGRDGRITRIFPVANAAQEPLTQFLMEPEAQLRAMRKVEAMGLDLVGTYHSHPRTPATPSARDGKLAAYPESLHLIVSLAKGEPEVRCYRITRTGSTPIAVKILFEYGWLS